MAAHTYPDLARHVGHEIVCVRYADGENVALECEECREVLLDLDRPAGAGGPGHPDPTMTEAGANRRRRDRAARAIAAYDGPEPEPGRRPARARDPEDGEEAISELLCDLHHLADELGVCWARLGERAERYHGEEAPRPDGSIARSADCR